MSGEKITKAHVAETGASGFAVAIEVSGHKLSGDEPEDSGGKNLGPSPYDYLVVALGECTAMTIRWYARQKNWPLEKVEVAVTHEKQKADGKPIDVFTKSIALQGAQLSAEQRDKLFEVAAKCPVQRTLEGAPRIETLEI